MATNYKIKQTDLENIFEPVRSGFASVTFTGYTPAMSFMARTGDAVNPNADGYYQHEGTIFDAHPKGYLIPKSLSYSGTWGTQSEGSAVNTSGITFTATYMDGTTATVTPSVSPSSWAVGSGQQTATFSYTYHGVTVTATKTCNMTYTWTTAASAHGTASGSGTYTYSGFAQTRTITATPDTYYELESWVCTGGSSCSASGSTLTINANCRGNITATASFAMIQRTITMATNNSTYGTTSIDDAIYYPMSTSQQKTLSYSITNTNIYQFNYWTTDVGSVSGNTLTIPADTNQDFTVTGNFGKKTFSITVTAGTGGSASGSTTYQYSTSAQTFTITQTASEGYEFSSWSVSGPSGGSASVSGTTLTVAANSYGNITVTANFEESWSAVQITLSYVKAFVSISGNLYIDAACTTRATTGRRYALSVFYYKSNETKPTGTYLRSGGTGTVMSLSGNYYSVYSSWVSSGAVSALIGDYDAGGYDDPTGVLFVRQHMYIGYVRGTSCTLSNSTKQQCYKLVPVTF